MSNIDIIMLSQLHGQLEIQLTRIHELESENDNLKCCGTCEWLLTCKKVEFIHGMKTIAARCCEHWQSDGMTKEQRKL